MNWLEKNFLASPFPNRLMHNPYLKAIRDGLTLTLPLVMAGSVAVLINNFPLAGYQRLMVDVFGDNWRAFGGNVWNGTFAIMSVVMASIIGHSLADHHNRIKPRQAINPAVVALVAIASLMVLVEPLKGMSAVPYSWLGINGLFLAIFVALTSTGLFFLLFRIKILRISFYSEEADSSIPHAFNSLLPGMFTILVFGGAKYILTSTLGIGNMHQVLDHILRYPFEVMGNTIGGSIVYNFLRHFFWFIGIHGSNLMEPITVDIYGAAMQANIKAAAQGAPIPFIFTKTFFDVFISMGGSGATICLILACLIQSRSGSMKKISQLSLVPAVFNINETMVFGLPIVLNPIFAIPFIATPIILSLLSYAFMYFGLVPPTTVEVTWTTPIFVSGYTATGSFSGILLQLFNVAVGTALYYPFVRTADRLKSEEFSKSFHFLISSAGASDELAPSGFLIRTDSAGALARSLANDLEMAIARNELSLEYQPQVDSRTGEVVGTESLLRWTHSDLGRIPPSLFIPLAEDTGLIRQFGYWALDNACGQLAKWQKEGLNDVVMSVNVSVHQLGDPLFVDTVAKIIARHGVPPGKVDLEVTESAVLGPQSSNNKTLHALHDLGVNLAIDDFGMGHTSLVYLKLFPVHLLKIDKILSKDVVRSKSSAEIIATISDLCRNLGIKVIVEFVETPEQLRAIQALSCYFIQGYLYSPPCNAENCTKFIRSGAKVI